MSRVILSNWALADLRDIGRHIAQHNPQASQRWVRKLRETCKQTIGTFPECGTRRDDLLAGMRSFSVGDYLIYFKSRDSVRILRIVHGTQTQENLRFEP